MRPDGAGTDVKQDGNLGVGFSPLHPPQQIPLAGSQPENCGAEMLGASQQQAGRALQEREPHAIVMRESAPELSHSLKRQGESQSVPQRGKEQAVD
jgi:hypothetical protein